MADRLSDRISEWVGTAIDTYRDGEPITFDLTMLPPPAEGRGPVLVIMVWMPSPVLGEFIHASFQWLQPGRATPTEIEDVVHQCLEQMRQARSQVLTQPPDWNGQEPL
jgi:hypothetical protein